MHKSMKTLIAIVLFLLPVMRAGSAEYRVPMFTKAPVLDGRIDPKEWAGAAGFDGLAWEGQLERRRARVYIGATEDTLYLAFLTQLPSDGALTTDVKTDSVKIVYDDSVEAWIDPAPDAVRGAAYQMLANSAGKQGFQMHARGGEKEVPAWRGNWRVVSGLHDGWWHCEIGVPLAEIAPGRRADEGVWGINLCRNWKQPWNFSSLGGDAYAPDANTRFVFVREGALAVAHAHRTDPASGDVASVLTLTNPTDKPLTARVEMHLTRDLMPEAKQEETVTVAPGERREVSLNVKDTTTRRFVLAMRVVSLPDGAVCYARSYKWIAGAPGWKWTTARRVIPPLDFQFAYYPYRNRMRLQADVTGLPPGAVVRYVTAVVRKKGGVAVKTVRLDRLTNGRQETSFALPEMNGTYEIAVRASGQNVPSGEVAKEFTRTRYPWERNALGRSERVYPPFTPIRIAGNRVATVLREHTMNGVGLWDQAAARGKPLLAAPMRFRVTAGGREIPSRSAVLRFTKRADNGAVTEGGFQAGALTARVRSTWDYDGTMRVDLTLLPTGGKSVEALTLEIPLRADEATLLHAMGDGIRNTLYEPIPVGSGTVWTSTRVQSGDMPRAFCTYLYAGTPVRGLSWFAENDRGWSWDRSRPNLEITRSAGTVTLHIHLIDLPTVISSPRTITFGLLAAPVKPRLEPWRHRWIRDNYSLLGTDVNWFALGDCGSVYPAGKDMRLWEALRRGNREKLSDAEVESVVAEGRKYFAPYGPEIVGMFEAHVRYNLRSRYGARMVFYYNRSSYQAADEFQTFQDEWDQTDYRSIGAGNSRGEIAIVPSDSYIDHALWWYGKSFDVAGNKGVYWDNWFFNPTYNTEMTGAYRREDGAIVPSTGIWGMRELEKRTFQYMNERRMKPITMPHTTSTSILPLLSFATVQYDWEWKYSEGDVQYRFPREYIQLVSNGELAGTWPVLLGDHGAQESDPWTQRTFAGVCLIHEMTPSGWLPQVWDPLLKPIIRLLDDPKLKIWRYWDETPSPVRSSNPDLPTIVYAVPGRETVVVVTGYNETETEAVLDVDAALLGFAGRFRVEDAETGQNVPVRDNRLVFALKKHDVREFRLVSAQRPTP